MVLAALRATVRVEMLHRHGSASNAHKRAIAHAVASALGVTPMDVQAEVATDDGDTVAETRILLSKTFCQGVGMLFCNKARLESVLSSTSFHERVAASLRLQNMCSQHKVCVKHVSRTGVTIYADGTMVMADHRHSESIVPARPHRKVAKLPPASAPSPPPLAMSDEVRGVVKAIRASPAALAVSGAAAVLLLCTLFCCCLKQRPAKSGPASPARRGNGNDGYSHVQMPEYVSHDVYGAADPRLALQSRAAAMYGAHDLQALAF